MQNKFKYYTVTTTEVVQARNQSDAVKVANGIRSIPGKVLGSSQEAQRVLASEAREMVSTS